MSSESEGSPRMENRIATWESPEVATAATALREKGPFVYGLTNYVAANLSANAVLALGGGPAIGAAPGWTSAFPAGAGGVWINAAAMMSAATPQDLITVASTAHDAGVPWVLDPVAVGAGAPEYDEVVKALLAYAPAIVRGNASEVAALAGGAGGTGVDSTLDSAEVIGVVADLAARLDAVIAVSGPVDYIVDPTGQTVEVHGGHQMMPLVTGTGCSLGAVCAAYSAVTDPLSAAITAHAAYAIAGARAGSNATGTGSFAVAFVDELSNL